MKVNMALAQIDTHLGDIQRNLEKHLELTRRAEAGGADLIVFPELSLTGYCLQDLAPSMAHHPSDRHNSQRSDRGGSPAAERLCRKSTAKN